MDGLRIGRALPLACLIVLAGCAAGSEFAAVDTVKAPVFADEGVDPEVAGKLVDSQEVIDNSPNHRLHEKRLANGGPANKDVRLPGSPFPEITGWGRPLANETAGAKHAETDTIDQSLFGLMRRTLENNGEIARAAEAVNSADIASTNAIFGYLPRASANLEYTHARQRVISSDNAVFREGSANFPALNVQTEICQPVIDFGRVFAISAADSGRSVARAAYVNTAQTVMFSVVTAYIDALESKGRIRSAINRIRLLDAQIAAERRLEATGRGVASAYQLLEIEKSSTAIELSEAEEDFADALEVLSGIVGWPVEDVTPFDLPKEVWQKGGSGDWHAYVVEALKVNPLAQQRRIEILQRRQIYKQSLSNDFLPTVEAFARQEYEDREASRFGGGSETLDHTVGVRVRVPIFNANGTGYQNEEELSAYRQAIISEAQLRRTLEAEIRTLLI